MAEQNKKRRQNAVCQIGYIISQIAQKSNIKPYCASHELILFMKFCCLEKILKCLSNIQIKNSLKFLYVLILYIAWKYSLFF